MGVYEDLAAEGRIIRHDEAALKIRIDLEKLSGSARAEAIETVRQILAKLKS